MRIGRTLAPAAAPVGARGLLRAAAAMVFAADPRQAREDEMRRVFAVDRAWLVSSGTTALTVTLMALKAGAAGKTDVVIPAYTCFTVPAAVLHAGLRPVPCDIDPRTFDFDHARLAATIGALTLCVVVHDLFGIPADVDRTRDLCRSRAVAVVEDAAQGMGVTWRGRPLGTRGDVGIFSLGRGKHLTCGSGGVIVTSSASIAAAIDVQYARLAAASRVRMVQDWIVVALMAFFIRPALYWIPAAVPWLRLGETVFPRHIPLERLSAMHAALLDGWPQRLARSNAARAGRAAALAAPLALSLVGGPLHPYLRVPVLVRTPGERTRLLARARAGGLGIGAGYPCAVSEIPEVRAVIGRRRCPNAAHVAARLVTLPTHHWVSARDVRAIVACLAPHPGGRSAPFRQRASESPS